MNNIKEELENRKIVIERSKESSSNTDFKQIDNAKSMINEMSVVEKEAIKRALVRKNAREHYIDYVRYVKPDYILTPFHKFMCNLMDNVVKRVENGEKVRICISVPPRSGKSLTITETLPSWFIGRNPNLRAIITGYSAEIAESFEDKNRQKTIQYGKELFNTDISDSQNNKTKYALKNHEGYVLGVGIQGGITGNGGELIIVDDPYKSMADAMSVSTRTLISQTFKDSVLTRLQGKGNALIVIHTRWVENDLIGEFKDMSGWYYINIPAISDGKDVYLHRKEGETLLPELGYDAKWAEETRNTVGSRVWEALYMGNPFVENGQLVKREWFNFYNKNQCPVVFDSITMSCDLSFGGTKADNDPCAIQIWGKVGANHYLLKRIKKRMDFIKTCETIKMLSAQYPNCAMRKIVERKANGQAVIDSLNNVIGGFVAYEPKESKESRLNSVLPIIEAGNVWLPSEDIDKSINEMVDECVKFPNGAHDDEVDAMSQYLICENKQNSGKIVIENTFKLLNEALRGIKL